MPNKNMKLSKSGAEGIAEFEGIERKGGNSRRAPSNANLSSEDPKKYYVYLDPIGLETIGIGHLITDKEKRSGEIVINGTPKKLRNGLSYNEVLELKRQDADKFESAVRNNITVPLTQGMFDALVSFSFNLGTGVLRPRSNNSGSTLVSKLQNGDYRGAADEFPKWNRAGGNVLAGLTRRRNWEREIFMKDIHLVENGDQRNPLSSNLNLTIPPIDKKMSQVQENSKNNSNAISNFFKRLFNRGK